MVDFRNIKPPTPEERAAREALEEAKRAEEAARVERLEQLERDNALDSWQASFARSVGRRYRTMEYLSDKQWTKIDEILDDGERFRLK